MKNFCLGAGVLAVWVGSAGEVRARNYTGSDSLRDFTLALVTQCGAINGGATYPALAGASPQYAYLGGGSGPGGLDMRNGEQDIAPMTRPLNAAEACEAVIEANPSTGSGSLGNDEAAVTISPPGSGAEGLVIGVDGLSIAVSPSSGARCDTTPADGFAAPLAHTANKTFTVTNFTTNVPDGAPSLNTFQDVPLPAAGTGLEAGPGGTLLYRFSDFKDVLRILFAGADKTRSASTAANGGGGNTQSAANRLSRCSSDIRRSLVSQWDNIVEGDPATCSSISCGTLRRLYRRADDTATTDVFLSLLGIAGVANQPFCNGLDRQDQDPIRRTCLPDDDVCGAQNLGLVQSVELRPILNVSVPNQHAAQYPTQPCAQGVFVLRDAPILPGGGSATTCPDGAPQILGQCLTPQAGPANAIGTAVLANCLNSQLNTSFLTPGGNDGRAFNRELRSSAGNMRNELIAGQTVPTGISNAIHRTRSRNSQCVLDASSTSLGCIAGNVSCSLGFSGREATDNPSNPAAVAAPVNNIPPSVANIQSFAYPLARKVYFTSILGFAHIRAEVPAVPAQAEQEQLIRCLENEPSAHSAALVANGYLPLPDVDNSLLIPGHVVEFRTGPAVGTAVSPTPGLLCEDINEVALCGSATNTPNCQRL